jgi:hypothetical protein
MNSNFGRLRAGTNIESTNILLSSGLSFLDAGLKKKSQNDQQNLNPQQPTQDLNAMALKELIEKNPDSAVLLQWSAGYSQRPTNEFVGL